MMNDAEEKRNKMLPVMVIWNNNIDMIASSQFRLDRLILIITERLPHPHSHFLHHALPVDVKETRQSQWIAICQSTRRYPPQTGRHESPSITSEITVLFHLNDGTVELTKPKVITRLECLLIANVGRVSNTMQSTIKYRACTVNPVKTSSTGCANGCSEDSDIFSDGSMQEVHLQIETTCSDGQPLRILTDMHRVFAFEIGHEIVHIRSSITAGRLRGGRQRSEFFWRHRVRFVFEAVLNSAEENGDENEITNESTEYECHISLLSSSFLKHHCLS